MSFSLLSIVILSTIISKESAADRYQGISPVTSVTLSSTAHDAAEPFTAVIHLTLAPDWYLYWTNPGDAGLPLAVQWTLPDGFRAGELRFPTPEKIVHEEIVAYGYHHELIVLCTLTPPVGYRAGRGDSVRADLDWLVCSESCIPGKASISFHLEENPSVATHARELVDRFSRQEPGEIAELGFNAGPAVATRKGGELLVHIPLTGAVDDFYPEIIDHAVIDHKRIAVDKNGITIPVTPYDSTTVVTAVRGLAIVRGKGYRLQTPLRQ